MFWKRICLPKLVNKRDHSTKRSRIRQENGGNNLVLNPVGIACGDEGLLGKRKIEHLSVESDKDLLKKKRRTVETNMVVYEKNPDVDRISELPEPIIHLIFSCIRCTKDVVRTSVLSKKWKSLFESYLTFDFDERWFRLPMGKGKHNRIKAREMQKTKFTNYVDKSLAKRLLPVPCIDKFKLHANCTSDKMKSNIDRWILAVVEKNVKELEVQVNTMGQQQYVLPGDVLQSTSATSMKLSGCTLDSSIPIKLSNLRQLSLKDVSRVTDDVIGQFQESCPLMEDLRLVSCRGLHCLTISSLTKLKRVEVHECGKLICISIAAVNLESFWYHARDHQLCIIDLIDSVNLKSLTLKDSKLKDTDFHEIISKCPLLEKLVLHECNDLKRVTILSGNLRSLALTKCLKLREVNIDAPNLYSFQYSGHMIPFSSMNVLGLREAKFSLDPIINMSQCVVECQKFFGNFDRSKGFKLIAYCKEYVKIYEEPREVHLAQDQFYKLELTTSLASVRKTVDNWLREFHGNYITLESPSGELIKLIETMVTNREERPNCCGYYTNKCWRHYLEGVFTANTIDKTFYGFKWRPRQKKSLA